MSTVPHGTVDCLLREFVEFLNGFTMDVDFTGFAENPHESSLVNFTRNDFGCQRETGEKRCEVSSCAGVQPLFIQNVLLNRCYFAHVLPACLRAPSLHFCRVRRAFVLCPQSTAAIGRGAPAAPETPSAAARACPIGSRHRERACHSKRRPARR